MCILNIFVKILRLKNNINLKLKYIDQMNTVNSGYVEIVPKKQICGKNKIW